MPAAVDQTISIPAPAASTAQGSGSVLPPNNLQSKMGAVGRALEQDGSNNFVHNLAQTTHQHQMNLPKKVDMYSTTGKNGMDLQSSTSVVMSVAEKKPGVALRTAATDNHELDGQMRVLAKSRSMPLAGFRQINTEVRRMGDFGDYYFDGSWKASSFANPSDYLEAKTRSPWTRTLHFKPQTGLTGPPSLWEINKITHTPVVDQDPIWPDGLSLRGNNTVGYTGYIPGKKCETVYGSIKSAVHDYCEGIRKYEQKDVTNKPLCYDNETQGRMPLRDILKRTDMKYTQTYGGNYPEENGQRWTVKDHEIPPRITPDYKTPGITSWMRTDPDPAYVVRGGMARMPGYTGYRPGRFNFGCAT